MNSPRSAGRTPALVNHVSSARRHRRPAGGGTARRRSSAGFAGAAATPPCRRLTPDSASKRLCVRLGPPTSNGASGDGVDLVGEQLLAALGVALTETTKSCGSLRTAEHAKGDEARDDVDHADEEARRLADPAPSIAAWNSWPSVNVVRVAARGDLRRERNPRPSRRNRRSPRRPERMNLRAHGGLREAEQRCRCAMRPPRPIK